MSRWECFSLIILTGVTTGWTIQLEPIPVPLQQSPLIKKSHTMTLGKMEADNLLLHQYENYPSWTTTGYVSEIFEYKNPQIVINFVHCLDLWTDGTGPYFRLLSGGVGTNHVKLNVTSQKDRGYHIIIQVYGTNYIPSSNTSTNDSVTLYQNYEENSSPYSPGLMIPFLPACVALTTMAVLFCVIMTGKFIIRRRGLNKNQNLTYNDFSLSRDSNRNDKELTELGVNQGFLKDDKDTVVYDVYSQK